MVSITIKVCIVLCPYRSSMRRNDWVLILDDTFKGYQAPDGGKLV
ncbi:hypothetical protein [Caldicoprobacter algeriensis]|nr:hypothetical protein [Caldicoprobacter algeriensis]